MKPFFQRPGITIYHGDCRDLLPKLAAKSVDLVLADPPYGDTSLRWDRIVEGWTELCLPILK